MIDPAFWQRPRKPLMPGVKRLASRLALVALLVFIAFEAGVRAIPPDAVQVTVSPYGLNGDGPTTTQTITDPRQVAALRAAITAQMTSYPAWYPLGLICNGGFGVSVTYRFTWHSIPVEVASGDSGNCGSVVLLPVSSGGLTDPFLYQWEQDV
jgi:hypothetical protein